MHLGGQPDGGPVVGTLDRQADRLVVAGSTQQALALSPYTGKILGQQELSGAASVPPVVAEGTVFVVTDSPATFAGIAADLPEQVEVVRLYENYLTTFRINEGLV